VLFVLGAKQTLSQPADDVMPSTPAHIAAATDNAHVLVELHRLGVAVAETTAHSAAESGHSDCLEALSQIGVSLTTRDSSGRTPLDVARDEGQAGCVRKLQQLLGAGVSPAASLQSIAPSVSGFSPAPAALPKPAISPELPAPKPSVSPETQREIEALLDSSEPDDGERRPHDIFEEAIEVRSSTPSVASSRHRGGGLV
jgi:hypothetical protein